MATQLTVNDLEEIQAKIEKTKKVKAQAEGALKNIVTGWERDYGVKTVEEAKAKLAELDADFEANRERRDKLLEKLANVTDWDNI